MRIPFSSRCWTNGSDRIVGKLHELGIRTIFSVPGSQILPVWDRIPRYRGMRLVVPRSERNAAFMGEGYGRTSHLPAVVMDTLGPGVANEAVGILSAVKSNAPVLFISPYHPAHKYRRLPEVFQGFDQPLFFRTICKESLWVEDARALPSTIDSAFQASLREPSGPVRVDIPFPILFQRHLWKKQGESPQQIPQRKDRMIWVTEDSEMSASPISKEMGWKEEEEDLLFPGVDRAGFGLPFALGIKFASPNTPVALVTEIRFLMENLDSLVLARMHQIPIRIVLPEGENGSLLEKIRDRFDVPWVPIRRGKDPKALLLENRRALTLLPGSILRSSVDF